MRKQSWLLGLVVAAVFCAAGREAVAQDARNLLANAGFERGKVGELVPGWTRLCYDGSKDAEFKFVVAEGGREGGHKAVLEKGAKEWVLVEQFVPVEIVEGQSAVFTVWMRSEKPISRVGLHLYLMPKGQMEGGLYNSRSQVAVGPEWKEYEVALPLVIVPGVADPKGCNLRPIVQLEKKGVLELDDGRLEIVKTETSPEKTAQAEAIKRIYAEDVPHVESPVGFFGGIVARPDGRLFGFTSGFQLTVSEDGGKTWSPKRKLAIDDPSNKITGAISMTDGSLGIWTESWGTPMYFWRSADGGQTWSKRAQIAPEGAPYHGNVMIETSRGRADEDPGGWKRNTCARDGRQNQPDSKSAFRRVPGGHAGNHAAALTLHEGDEWVYAETRIKADRALRAADEYVFRVAAKAQTKAAFDLYIEAWNPQTNKGSGGRKRFEAGSDWQEYEVKLSVTEEAEGLESFRVVVQLYTAGVELLFDDVRVERIAPKKDAGPLALANASFEGAAIGRLVIPVRQGWAFSGGAASEDYMAGGIDIRGERIFIEGHGQQAEMCITYVHYSDDGGLTWRRSHPVFIWRDDGYGGIGMADEPNVAELKDGRLIMFMRNPLGRIYQTFSADGGRTWAYPTPTELPSSLSPCCLRRIPANEHTLATGRAGDLLCVWNNVSHDEIKRGFRRGRLSAAISRDDGKTWINAKTIDTAGLPAISGMAPLSPPGFVRADRDLGRLPVPIGFVDYADLTFLGDRVLVKYAKKLKNPPLAMPTRIRFLPLGWFYSTE